MQPALFRHRTFTLGLCISLLFQFCLGGFLLILTLLLQDGLGYTPLHTALTTLPFAAAVGGGISFVSRRLSRRLGARLLSLGMGMTIGPIGPIVLSDVDVRYAGSAAGAMMVDIVLLLSACGVSFMLPKRGAFTGPTGH